MKIIVTGSSGMIGTALCERLEDHHDVVPVDMIENRWNKGVNGRTKFVDLREPSAFDLLPDSADLVIHCAANARVYDLILEPALALENITTTFNTLEYARRSGIPRFVFLSSREVYGTILSSETIAEDMVNIQECESPYAASKLAGESLAHSYDNVYGINCVVVRLSNVYGRYDDSSRVVPTWIRKCLVNEPLVIYGSEKILDFTYLDDTVNGIVGLTEKFDQVSGATFNISSGNRSSLMEVAEIIQNQTKSSSPIVHEETRTGEVWKYAADITAIQKAIGYSADVDIDEGIRRSISWYLSQIESPVT